MANIIPPLNKHTLARMTSGERRFAQRLRDLLEEDYLCWYDIPVGSKRRYPDFIVLHPSRGLLFLEVKDWKPETIKSINLQTVTLQTATGRKTVANPFEQVRQCTHAAINTMQGDPQLCQENSKHKGRLITPYGWGVVFTNVTRKQIESSIPEAQRQRLLPDHLMIYRDEMTEGTDAESFQERLWNMFPYTFQAKLSVPEIDRIRWHLFPELRIDVPRQEGLFAPDDETEEGANKNTESLPDIVRILDIQQEQLARSLGEGHRVIHGVAGSGKTLILGYRAELLAKTSSKPILILCFNVTLAAKLKSLMAAKGITDQVNICHFHDWCKTQLQTYHVQVKQGVAPYWERQVVSVIDAVDSGQIPRAQYGAVLIDEGHDFDAEWLKLIVQMIDPDTNALLLLYDDAQSIYKKKAGLGFSLSSVGVQAKGRTTILKLNYRNTREILGFAYRFAHDCLNEISADEDHIPLIKPEAAGMSGDLPVVRHVKDWNAELDYTIRCLRAWQEQGLAWKDMAILYVAGYQGSQLNKRLKAENIPLLWMASKDYKQAYDPNIDRVTVMTLQSSKGLEFPAVAVVGVGQLNNPQSAQDVRLLYVGMTRAQKFLEMHCCGDTPINQRLISLAS